ncbi:MAG: SiaB family protein kinase [Chromatiaceae bacterium]|nr:SiaB family protein kinase [Chromatiaceae bacterium]
MSMTAESLAFHQQLQARGVIFSFVGYLSEGILYSLGEALKQKMSLEATDANVIKRVFSVFVEQAQNIIRYSADRVAGELDRPVELSSGLVVVGREEGRFSVVCANIVAHTEVGRLRERLEQLAAMDADELKSHYREKLREPSEADSRGGSIGLIEIARRSSAPIEFGFIELDAERTYFCLKAYI